MLGILPLVFPTSGGMGGMSDIQDTALSSLPHCKNYLYQNGRKMIEETWCPVPFTENERDLIRERVRDIGFRLQKSPKVLKMSRIARQQSGYKKQAASYPLYNLAQGPLGLALMYHELDRVWPEDGWDLIAHKYLAEPLRELSVHEDQTPGLLSGICGLSFVLLQLSDGGTHYQDINGQLKTVLSLVVSNYTGRLVLDEYPHPANYDLVSGAVGICAALLMQENALDAPETRELFDLLYHLVWLGRQDMMQYMGQFDSWYHSPHLRTRQMRWQAKDSAFIGYGMRCGLASLVALLSLVMLNGLDTVIQDIPETLVYLCGQIREGMHRDEQGVYWPQDAPPDVYHSSGICAPFAWCNGTTGIARALWLAGLALHDDALCTLALECLSEAGKRFRKEPLLIGPSLCHGLAGMIQTYAHFAHETGLSTLSNDIYTMTTRLLELFEADRPFGYRAFGPEYIRFDSPWLFEGAAGVALALLTTVSPKAPSWDRVMLLA
jgi:lantibiotic modifying enzyme